LYSNFDLWLHGSAEWQAGSGPTTLIWSTGADASFWRALAVLALVATAMTLAFVKLAALTRADRARGSM
jgi:hypothetical protein